MNYDYSKLRGRIVEKFMTLGNFAKTLNCELGIVSRYLNGKTEFRQSTIIKWANILDISPYDIGVYFFTPKVDK